METTPGGHILEIGAEYLLGVGQDDDDVEQVRLYGIAKPE